MLSEVKGRDPKISFHPSPASETVGFSGSANIRVLNQQGQEVLKKQSVKEINISVLPEGMYFLLFTDSHERILQVEKLVKAGW